VILYHTTSFGTTEHSARDAAGGPGGDARDRAARSRARAAAAGERLAAWLAAARAGRGGRDAPDGRAGRAGPGGTARRPGPAGVVLTGPAAVAWATGGIAPPVDRTAGVDLIWVVRTPAGASLITTEVEAGRIRAEYGAAAHGFADLVAVPWYEPAAFVAAAQDLAGAPASALAADGHPAFGADVSADLVALRLALSPAERDDLRDLGADTAGALEAALAAWRPGERDLDIQARCAAFLEARGADAPVLIVGGDERVERYRHPMAAGVPVRRLAMAVAVARRDGLHAAATRFACAGPLPPGLAAVRDRVLGIERQVLAACAAPGASYGDALAALDHAYRQAGAPGAWAGHYQGGPIGFAQREFEIAPGQSGSRWYAEPVAAGHALAWNPSLPGGAKAEDTYLVTGGTGAGLERVTSTPDWPVLAGDELRPARPAVLEAGA
jgi:Xaa-Pro dipeptidase